MAETARQRWVVIAEFGVEVVQREAERRTARLFVAQISRELDVRDGLLEKWQRRAAERAGAPAADALPGKRACRPMAPR